MLWAFVITTYIRNLMELDVLLECIRRIRLIYPNKTVYVLDDYSFVSVECELKSAFPGDSKLLVYKTMAPKGGEVNPYLFILSKECRHTKLVFIHDSCMINRSIDHMVAITDLILFLWTTPNTPFYINTTDEQINDEIQINNQKVRVLLRKYLHRNKWICFGGMSIFTNKFAQLIKNRTNLFSKADLFQTRDHRCFFERILFLIARELIPSFSKLSLQGDIFDHPNAFQNTDPTINSDGFFTKIWMGR